MAWKLNINWNMIIIMTNINEREPKAHEPGGLYYDTTPEGQQELKKRTIMSYLLKPGDEVVIDYVFGGFSPAELTCDDCARVVGWEEYVFICQYRDYTSAEGKPPGIYRNYSRVKIQVGDLILTMRAKDIKLADPEEVTKRMEQWGNKPIPRGFQRVDDLPNNLIQS
jgi:hypothetical protein